MRSCNSHHHYHNSHNSEYSIVPTPTSKILTGKEKKTDESEVMSKLWCYCNEP